VAWGLVAGWPGVVAEVAGTAGLGRRDGGWPLRQPARQRRTHENGTWCAAAFLTMLARHGLALGRHWRTRLSTTWDGWPSDEGRQSPGWDGDRVPDLLAAGAWLLNARPRTPR
jgi:hypothetical protein